MAGNRVEELEARVRDLEATVEGLTDELVETKERLHAMENGDESYPDIIEGRPTRSGTPAEAAADGGAESADGGAESQDDAEGSADEVNTDEADEEDNADSESGDDIIVA